jgi:hypothetical protein
MLLAICTHVAAQVCDEVSTWSILQIIFAAKSTAESAGIAGNTSNKETNCCIGKSTADSKWNAPKKNMLHRGS